MVEPDTAHVAHPEDVAVRVYAARRGTIWDVDSIFKRLRAGQLVEEVIPILDQISERWERLAQELKDSVDPVEDRRE